MASNRVYIGRLSSRASERDIEHFFRGYGRLRDIVMKNGFGFVEFDTSRDADDAIYDLNGKELAGERVQLELSRRRPDRGGGGGFGGPPMRRDSRYGPPTQTRHRLIVENLSTRISWQDLKDMMRSYGDVTYADAHKERRNEGILCFATRDDLKRAMDKMQGKDVNGRKLKLIDDSEKRGGGSSRSRSRSPRRSRSRSRRSSRSRSRSSRSRSHSKSRSRSRSKGRDAGKTRDSRSKSRSRTRSASPKKENGGAGDRDRSRSRSGSPRGRSASPNGHAAEKSPAKDDGSDRSRSASPA